MSEANAAGAVLALDHDKSRLAGCPTPRPDRVLVLWDGTVRDIGCGRNTCPVCRRRNVRITAAMLGITAEERAEPPTHAVLSTTRDWIDEKGLRLAWQALREGVQRDVGRKVAYAWLREWTEGKRDGVRRTHYHSVWCGLSDAEAAAVAARSLRVFGERAGATSEKAHGWQRVWDAGGLARYMAGLVGHHLKEGQAPPPGWSGRRFATSRSPRFYVGDAVKLRARATAVAGEDALRHRLEEDVLFGSADRLPEEIRDAQLTRLLREVRAQPAPRVMSRDAARRLVGRGGRGVVAP